MPDVGVPELLIILVVVLVVFGASRLADIGGSMGKAIKEFRREVRDGDETPAVAAAANGSKSAAPTAEQPVIAGTATCGNCGTVNPRGAKFCAECGNSLTAAATPATPICSKCGAENAAGAKFCAECGTALRLPVS